MELSQLRTFRAVAEHLNFTRAAKQLHLTQSAVSHQIKALESELGEPLFIRTRRGVKLSEAGSRAMDYAARILDEASALFERVSQGTALASGRLRAAAATQAFVYLFSPLFERFIRAFPGIELTFRTTASTEQTIQDIKNGTVDVGFASVPVFSPELQVTELFEDELFLIVGRSHRLAGKVSVKVEEIARERIILFERGASLRRATDQFFNRAGLAPSFVLESNDTLFVKLMIEHGVGISLLPPWAVREEVLSGKLTQSRIENYSLTRTIAMVSLGQFQPSSVRTFLAYILDHKPELQALAKGELV